MLIFVLNILVRYLDIFFFSHTFRFHRICLFFQSRFDRTSVFLYKSHFADLKPCAYNNGHCDQLCYNDGANPRCDCHYDYKMVGGRCEKCPADDTSLECKGLSHYSAFLNILIVCHSRFECLKIN